MTHREWILEVLAPDGSVTREVPLRDGESELGRIAEGLSFPEDPQMSDVHACIRTTSAGVEWTDSGQGSGIWLRIRDDDGRPLVAQDQIWLGSQILVVMREGDRWMLRHHGPDGELVESHEVHRPRDSSSDVARISSWTPRIAPSPADTPRS